MVKKKKKEEGKRNNKRKVKKQEEEREKRKKKEDRERRREKKIGEKRIGLFCLVSVQFLIILNFVILHCTYFTPKIKKGKLKSVKKRKKVNEWM